MFEPALIGFVAGEPSGDVLAAPIVAALRARVAGLACAGIAGDLMQAAGCEPWWHVRELSVRGYVEVLRELPRLLRLRRKLRQRLIAAAPALVVGVDAPDFNLQLETDLRASGIATVHCVSPSIWAWRANRIETIRRAADLVLLVFPFEQAIYDAAGIPATYIGHPLASQIPLQADRGAARRALGLASGGPLVAVLPGSRAAEIEYIAPAFLGAIAILAAHEARLRFVIPAATPQLRMRLRQMLDALPALAERVQLTDGGAHAALAAADVVLVASGTATLEAALFKRPMVIAYRLPRLSAWLTQRSAQLPWVGLPNILLHDAVVPELLQHQATPDALARAVLAQLGDERGRRDLAERFEQLHEQLRRDTPVLASDAILALAARRGGRKS